SIRNRREYFSELKKRYVVVDQEERRKLILKQSEDMISHLRENHPQAKILGDEELLEEVVYLVEYPTPFLGEFDRQFLSLPVPVLRACLRDYQKHFSLADGDRILPYFVGIREGNRDYLDEVVDGNRRVLNARLTDAQFFFSQDTKKIFDTARVSELKEIVVQEKLGSYYDKAKRLAQISDKIVSRITKTKKEENELYPRVSEAAWLCKLDLTTQMVKEFPSLQGTMGAEYARRSGKDARVAQAVSEHRLPRFSNDKLPETLEGAILALADKMDTVVGSFWAGFIPSGSEDPWGLRRDAQGIVEIILDRGWRIDLDGLLEEVLALYTENDKDIIPRIRDFFENRIRNVLKEKGIGIRETNAILSIGFADITDAVRRAEALGKISRRREFKDQVIAIVRLVNMLKQAQQWKVRIPQVVREDLLREKEEKELYELRMKLEGKIESLLNKQKYVEAYQELSRFEEPIHDFFDKVLVMSEEESLRKNRLSLLNGIGKFFNSIADFTQLQVK
ncbi:glycine--tRNA ligase subunit beta, partial [Candidatus Aerophobetes bacterium]